MSTKSAKLISSPEQLTLHNLKVLADDLKLKGKFHEAEELYRQSLEGREHTLGPDHPETYDIVFSLAELLESRKLFQEAEDLYLRCFKGREKMLGKTQQVTCDAAMALGLLYTKLARYSKATEMFQYAYDGYFSQMGKSNFKTVDAHEHLVESKKHVSSVCIVN